MVKVSNGSVMFNATLKLGKKRLVPNWPVEFNEIQNLKFLAIWFSPFSPLLGNRDVDLNCNPGQVRGGCFSEF